MSGGGLNYVQNQDLQQLLVNNDIDAAIKLLEKQTEGSLAARQCQSIKENLLKAHELHIALYDVLEALDKHLSFDWDIETVNNAIKKFNQDNDKESSL